MPPTSGGFENFPASNVSQNEPVDAAYSVNGAAGLLFAEYVAKSVLIVDSGLRSALE